MTTPSERRTNEPLKIQILRVIGTRAQTPVFLATVNDYLVRWRPRDGWTCTCEEDAFPECPHIPAIENLLDPRVTGKDHK
jgi:hypothetical protein